LVNAAGRYSAQALETTLAEFDTWFFKHNVPEPIVRGATQQPALPEESTGQIMALISLQAEISRRLAAAFTLLDANGNGFLDSADFPKNPRLWVALQKILDKDHNGTIDRDEWRNGMKECAMEQTLTFVNGKLAAAGQRQAFKAAVHTTTFLEFQKEMKYASNCAVQILLEQADGQSNGGGGGGGPYIQPAPVHGDGADPELVEKVRQRMQKIMQNDPNYGPPKPSRIGMVCDVICAALFLCCPRRKASASDRTC
jgi:hypothetical protein